jgi:hypothetical protein
MPNLNIRIVSNSPNQWTKEEQIKNASKDIRVNKTPIKQAAISRRLVVNTVENRDLGGISRIQAAYNQMLLSKTAGDELANFVLNISK